ncbi:hypothetical protein KIL84_011104 [Mauremys mutica]|uniref:Uncharacterized protein n=1 Tax=Mauremys mutica TaxID=74926 RepID=A0A9D4AV25_9SAUR|nr:hypothetical protein KIL84_011104 [Mauremys mutica]
MGAEFEELRGHKENEEQDVLLVFNFPLRPTQVISEKSGVKKQAVLKSPTAVIFSKLSGYAVKICSKEAAIFFLSVKGISWVEKQKQESWIAKPQGQVPEAIVNASCSVD